jgi:hypothetical protein
MFMELEFIGKVQTAEECFMHCIVGEVWGSHDDKDEEDCLVVCSTV